MIIPFVFLEMLNHAAAGVNYWRLCSLAGEPGFWNTVLGEVCTLWTQGSAACWGFAQDGVPSQAENEEYEMFCFEDSLTF